jgi:hypothetical protein
MKKAGHGGVYLSSKHKTGDQGTRLAWAKSKIKIARAGGRIKENDGGHEFKYDIFEIL